MMTFGEGRPVLVLHGGGGPQTVSGWAEQYAKTEGVRTIVPVHPGFQGTPRPDGLDSIGGLAELYADLLAELDLHDVVVVGNSIGGWIAAELAVLGSERVSGYVLVDAVGIEAPGHPVVDFFGLTMAEVVQHSYYEPARFAGPPPPEALAVMPGNRAALQVYGGTSMTDPTLAGRLASVTAPVLVVWGEADRIADPDYGRAYAEAIPGARFELLRETGHLPQLETPTALTKTVSQFTASC